MMITIKTMKKFRIVFLISGLSLALLSSIPTRAADFVKFINATNIPQHGSSEICETVIIFGHHKQAYPNDFQELAVLKNCATAQGKTNSKTIDLANYDKIKISGDPGTKVAYYDKNRWASNGANGHTCNISIHINRDTGREIHCLD